MKNSCRYMMILTAVVLFAVAGGLMPEEGRANVTIGPYQYPQGNAEICANDAATPPFLSGGVDPNLLLVIDNSASMLDLAYVEDGSNCFDDTYDNTKTYAGYFEPSVYYVYDITNKKFERWNNQSYFYNGTDGSSGFNFDTRYYTVYVVYMTMKAGPSATSFLARGNFLNWAAASKLDIQKEILTGGKYESGQLVMESRGCGNKRFVKKYAFAYPTPADPTDGPYTLTMAVTRPKEKTFPAWTAGETYTAGVSVVNDTGELYIATTTGVATNTGVADDGGVSWAPYTKTRWTASASYVVGDIVVDPTEANTIDEGQLYIATAGGTASGGGGVDADNAGDASKPKWEPYNVTQLELFETIQGGFDNSACQSAVEELNSDSPNQGLVKQDIDKCMEGNALATGNTGELSNFNAAFNHSIHNCWYVAKQDEWPPGSGPVVSIQPACEAVYTSGIQPWDVSISGSYICSGMWDGDADPDTKNGYVGRCWNPGTGYTLECTQYWMDGTCKKEEWVCTSPPCTTAGWADDGSGSVAGCIEQGLKDYCGVVEIPQVIDPSDQIVGTDTLSGASEEFWNIPALLTDAGVVAQLGQPLLVMEGFIDKPSAPKGLIQEFSGDLRMGAMVFHAMGSLYECNNNIPADIAAAAAAGDTSPAQVLFECAASNKDGGSIISEIDKSGAHTTSLVNAINAIKATSWTPIAEAIYNAIGYYAQRSDMRLDAGDFKIVGSDAGAVDPITAYCQDNNILIITEGASTADINDTVKTFVAGNDKDADTDVDDCGILYGSTLLDDLAWFAKNSSNCHTTQINDAEGTPQDKQNISTHIVVAGTLRDAGTGECNPSTLLNAAAQNGGTELYEAADPTQLENTLRAAFAAIRAGAAAGSAASVISASRSGEGAAYQAIFWPSVDLPSGDKVQWIGEVHALLVDSLGYLYEDSNGDHALDSGDARIIFFFDESINQTKACIGELDANGACVGVTLDLEDVKYHWSAAEWLSKVGPIGSVSALSATDYILQNRTPVQTPNVTDYLSNLPNKKRFIFTWNDLDNDGIVTGDEMLDFTPGTTWSTLVSAPVAPRGPVTLDFGVQTNTEVDRIIRWVRGMDYTPDNMRLRQRPYDLDKNGSDEWITWRLGDVIHSTPISVAAPAEGYHFLYRDNSYAQFVTAYKKRRHMIYFGGNDGMMHAVNGGFYDEAQKKFCRTVDCSVNNNTPELGAEMWAYVPYNLLPHLKCLTSEDYQHKYFVDQRPRIFDVRLWDPNDATDTVHVGGWGTILVGAMRFGGGKVRPGLLDLNSDMAADYPTDTREFTSAYFVMDITDPDQPPVLLAEMTRTTSGSEAEMAYTSAIPTLVVMKHTQADLSVTYKWYLIMGSGPTDVNGFSEQQAGVAVMPLDWLGQGGATARAFRIPTGLPTVASNQGGLFNLSYTSDSFVSDLVTVDYELVGDYKSDVVYFGTVSGTAAPYGGGMQRLVTRQINGSTGKENETLPSQWATLLNTPPFTDNHSSLNNPLPLIDVNQPVTATASVGTDGKNYWIYFGTGRFLDSDDKTDASQQSYYGIKEPLFFSGSATNCVSSFTWQTVEKTDVNDGHHNSIPGDQWLLNVSDILVQQATTSDAAVLSCKDGTTDCLEITPTTLTTFDTMDDYIAGTGTGCSGSDSSGTDGWYKNFSLDKERNVGQATLLGGLLTYTTYQPYADPCLPEGLGYLYGDYYRTGTPFYIPVFLSNFSTGVDAGGNVIDQVALGRGLATTPNLHVGKQEGAKAFVQTSTGTIVEIPQPNLPIQNAKTGKASWGEIK